MPDGLSKAQKEAAKREIDKQVEEIKQATWKQLDSEIAGLVEEVLIELQDRGVDIHQEDVDIVGIVLENVIEAMFGTASSHETVEIAVGGRANSGLSNEMVIESDSDDPNTYTEEVPIEAGDDPETVEVERADPGTDPRLNSDLSDIEISRAFREGLTPEMLRERYRTNGDETPEQGDEYETDDIPEAGLPWFQ